MRCPPSSPKKGALHKDLLHQLILDHEVGCSLEVCVNAARVGGLSGWCVAGPRGPDCWLLTPCPLTLAPLQSSIERVRTRMEAGRVQVLQMFYSIGAAAGQHRVPLAEVEAAAKHDWPLPVRACGGVGVRGGAAAAALRCITPSAPSPVMQFLSSTYARTMMIVYMVQRRQQPQQRQQRQLEERRRRQERRRRRQRTPPPRPAPSLSCGQTSKA